MMWRVSSCRHWEELPRCIPLVAEAENRNQNSNSSSSGGTAYAGLSVPSLGSASPETLAAQLGIDLPAKLLVRVSQSHLRDYLKSNFVELQTRHSIDRLSLVGTIGSTSP